MALQNVGCFLRLETSGNKAVEKQNLKQDNVKCLGDMSAYAFYCESQRSSCVSLCVAEHQR